MSERMVIVIEYEVITGEQVEPRDYMQRALTGAMTQIREGAERLDPNHVKVVGVHVGVDEFVDRVLALFDKKPDAPSKAPSSPVETTAGSGRRPDHTGVIRGADEAEARFERYRVALREVLLDVIDGENSTEDDCADDVAKEAIALADAENAALTTEVAELKADHSATFREGMLGIREGTEAVVSVMAERNDARAEVARLAARADRFAVLCSQDQDHAVKAISERNVALRTIADRDASIERLRAQLNEATNVPGAPAQGPDFSNELDAYVAHLKALGYLSSEVTLMILGFDAGWKTQHGDRRAL